MRRELNYNHDMAKMFHNAFHIYSRGKFNQDQNPNIRSTVSGHMQYLLKFILIYGE